MIFQNLMIQWNPTFVLIDINKLFLLDNYLFLPIFRPHCSWSSKDHQTENLLWTCSSFHSQSRTGPHRAWMDHNDQCPARFLLRISQSARALRTLFMIDIVCVTTNCRVKDEWKRSWYKDNSFTKNLVRICFFERVRDSISAESETAWELAGMEVLRDKSHALPVLSLHRVMG